MRKQPNKNYKCFPENIKKEDGDIIYMTTIFIKLLSECRGADDKHSIE